MPISPGESLYSKEPCQGRVHLSNEVISIGLSTEKNIHILKIYFLNTVFEWYQNVGFLDH